MVMGALRSCGIVVPRKLFTVLILLVALCDGIQGCKGDHIVYRDPMSLWHIGKVSQKNKIIIDGMVNEITKLIHIRKRENIVQSISNYYTFSLVGIFSSFIHSLITSFLLQIHMSISIFLISSSNSNILSSGTTYKWWQSLGKSVFVACNKSIHKLTIWF